MDGKLEHGGAPVEARSFGDLVRLTGVQKYYGSGLSAVRALHGIDLQVGSGEMVSICGPSGSGKTSLLNLIGLLDTASEGSVVIASLLVGKLSEQARADLRSEMIGFVFQAFTLIPVMTARENVMLPLMLRGHLEAPELQAGYARADALLASLGLANQADQFPPRLDASQSQRVAIARALIGKPRLVLADEPTSRLDQASTRQVMDLFAHQQDEFDTTFIVTTRDQRQFSRVTRALQLTEGHLLNSPTSTPRKPLRAQI